MMRIKPGANAVLAACAALGALTLAGCGGNSDTSAMAGQAVRSVMGGVAMGATTTATNGVSTVTFAGNASRYTITANASGGYSVTDTEGTEGVVPVTLAQRLQFADTTISLDVDGIPGKAYRLYQAAFNRVPDIGGLGFWIAMLDNGVSWTEVSAAFIASAEFKAQYGDNPTNAALVTAFYTNVLHRAPEAGGYAFWLEVLDKNRAPLTDVLLAFSNGQENYDAVKPTIAAGLGYTPLNRVVANTVPGTPTIGSGTSGNGTASVAFTAPASNGGSVITSYTATCTGSGASKTASGATSPLLVSGLTNGVAYSCSVKATNALGNSTASGNVSVTPAGTTTGPVVTVPGAPTIGTGTAASASASIAFTAPSSTGGAAITGYTASCTGGGGSRMATGTASPIAVTSLTNGTAYACSVTATNSAGTGSASSTVSVTPVASTSSGTSTTAGVMCSYSQSTANPTNGLASTSAITCTSTLRTITGTGIPDHTIGAFPNSYNPNSVAAVNVRFSNTVLPAVVSTTGTAVDHIMGYANNSVKFDPSTAESYQNAGVWKIEALNQTYFKFGTDTSNAHVQPDGAYHYHGMPEEYLTKLGKGKAMTLVGFAVDGFPIYARYGYTTATDATSAVKVMTASYRVKTTASSGRPSTSIANLGMGVFTQDYEYVAGLGDLDECNGRTGVTPEFPNGIYHYYITDGYPYIQRCVKGTAAKTN